MLRFILSLSALVVLSYAGNVTPNTPTSRKSFVDLHNKYRADTGKSMDALVWDTTLETYAAGMADKCKFAHDPAHKYGENIYWASNTQTPDSAAPAASAAWQSEIAVVDAAWNCAYGKAEKTCGHYSQQVWANTKKIGCATAICSGATMVFCEYDPPGNAAAWSWETMSVVFPPPY